jgi:hypothetical protein
LDVRPRSTCVNCPSTATVIGRAANIHEKIRRSPSVTRNPPAESTIQRAAI